MIVGFRIGLANCWPYVQMPSGYPSGSRIQTMMIGMKLISLVGSCLGVGVNVNVPPIASVEVNLPIVGKLVSNYTEVETEDTVFDGIPVRIYRPPDRSVTEILPGIVYYYGGAFVVGNPASFDDCFKATTYFLLNAAKYNVDAGRVATCGDSAGGNLAAAVPLRLRDEQFPIKIKLQALLYPWVQMLDYDLPSMVQDPVHFTLTRALVTSASALYIEGNENHLLQYGTNNHVIKAFRENEEPKFINISKLPKEFLKGYVRPPYPAGDAELWSELKDRLLNPYLAPLTASNLKNLPEAFVNTMDFDPLRDEGYLYGIRLMEANIKVTLHHSKAGFHGMYNFLEVIPYADSEFEQLTTFIKEKL